MDAGIHRSICVERGIKMELDILEGFIATMLILLTAFMIAGYMNPTKPTGTPTIEALSLAESLRWQASMYALLDMNYDFQPLASNISMLSGKTVEIYIYYANETVVCGGIQAHSIGEIGGEASASNISYQPYCNNTRVVLITDRDEYRPGWTVTVMIGIAKLDGRVPKDGRVWVKLVNESNGEEIAFGGAYRENYVYKFTYEMPNETITQPYTVRVETYGENFKGTYIASFQVTPGAGVQPPQITPIREDYWIGETMIVDNSKGGPATWKWSNQKTTGTTTTAGNILKLPLNSSYVAPGFWIIECIGGKTLVYVHPFTVIIAVRIGG